MSRLKKRLLIASGIIVLMLLLLIPIASFLAKYLIQKYDMEYTGREAILNWAYVNPFTGYVYLDDLVIYEQGSDEVFISMKGLSANMAMLKLFTKTYEIEEIELIKPYVHIVDKEHEFNFSDLIEKFTPDSNKVKSDKDIHFSMLNISISDGEFHYDEEQTPVNYFIYNVNIGSEGLRYNVDTLPIQFSFSSGIGLGDIAGDITIHLDNQDYRLAVKIDSFDLAVINQYLKDLTNYGVLAAVLDADVKSAGNFKSIDSITTSGMIVISDFHFGKNKNEDFAAFEQFAIDIVKLSPKNFIYQYDSISLKKPFIRYEKYDSLDNFQTIFGEGGQNVVAANAKPNKFNLVIEMATLIEQLSKNLIRSHYKVGRVAIYDGSIQFSDYSLGEKFDIGLASFNVVADSVDKDRGRIKVKVQSEIKPHGKFWIALSVNPKDSSYFDLDYRFHKIPLSMFNPYIKTYTSFPMDRGSMELAGNWRVISGNIKSDNHLIIIDPRVSKRVRNKDTKWIPIPLALAVVRERGNVIDYEIPITGNLNDPKFNFWDVTTDLLKNIFVNPVTTPYRMEVKSVERKLEKSLSMKWEMQQRTLSSSQETFIKKMIDFLKDNPEAHIAIVPQHYKVKEQEFILLFEAKKSYFLAKHNMKSTDFSKKDSMNVHKMSIKDVGFINYLDTRVKSNTLFTVQHKAAQLIQQSLVNTRFEQLTKDRQLSFLALFKEDKLDNRVKFLTNKNLIPFNGFSFYEIGYKGDFPDYLRDAHDKMNEFDDLSPRKKYKDKRENIIKAK
ncbi:MAG: DUF748 domain-containing protein [Flavobacteriales bacterium]